MKLLSSTPAYAQAALPGAGAPGSALTPPAGGAAAAGGPAAGLPHGIRGTLVIPLPWWELALLVVAAVGLIAVLVWLLRWYQRRRRARPLPPRDPWEELEARLQGTQPAMPFSRKAQEDFFYALSLILREAIERRTQVPATDRTCQELRTPLRHKLPLKPEDIEGVLTFLERADFIKFAQAPADTAEAMTARARVASWVHALIPPSVDQPMREASDAAS